MMNLRAFSVALFVLKLSIAVHNACIQVDASGLINRSKV